MTQAQTQAINGLTILPTPDFRYAVVRADGSEAESFTSRSEAVAYCRRYGQPQDRTK